MNLIKQKYSPKNTSADIKTKDGICDAFIAYPEDKGQYPAVLFLMDGFGVRDYLYEMVRTIASHGYYVLLPNLLYRVRRAPVLDIKFPLRPEDMPVASQKLMALFSAFDPELAMQDTGVFLNFLNEQKEALPGKIGITGYCMGGGVAIRAAARYPDRIAAAASFHASRLATDAPDSPHLLLPQIKAELYIGHADNDKNMPPEQIERLQKALKQSGIRYEEELYNLDTAHKTGALHVSQTRGGEPLTPSSRSAARIPNSSRSSTAW